ncbi:MAG: sugar isomerase domain-containing protein [Bacillota bacterium]
MSGSLYLEKIGGIISEIRASQLEKIEEAAKIMADSIAGGHLVHLFGSGHSVIPVMDVFPRYGSFVGFHPLLDPRLMWFNVVGPGGARELLWLEREPGYVSNFLQSFEFHPKDTLWVFSHSGLNAAPVEAAIYAKDKGVPVVAVVSGDNHKRAHATHSSGKKLGDLADVVIDNCVPLEDALVYVEGFDFPVAAGSTVAAAAIACAIVAEVAKLLVAAGIQPSVFVSPNVKGIGAGHNQGVFVEYARRMSR